MDNFRLHMHGITPEETGRGCGLSEILTSRTENLSSQSFVFVILMISCKMLVLVKTLILLYW